MKTIRSKLWSVVSGNQTVSGGGRDQNQSIPDFVRGYKYSFKILLHDSPEWIKIIHQRILNIGPAFRNIMQYMR
jgi:hypothetical protein